jgi:hypothetical protein
MVLEALVQVPSASCFWTDPVVVSVMAVPPSLPNEGLPLQSFFSSSKTSLCQIMSLVTSAHKTTKKENSNNGLHSCHQTNEYWQYQCGKKDGESRLNGQN